MEGRGRKERSEISENISMETGENAEKEQSRSGLEEGAQLAQPEPPSWVANDDELLAALVRLTCIH